MRALYTLIFIVIASQLCKSQGCEGRAIRLNAKADTTVPSITLTWPFKPQASYYFIYKKDRDDSSWGTQLATLSGTDSTYTDLDVAVDSAYEYEITEPGTAYGYIYAGIRFPAREKRGTIILMVDSLFTDSLSAEIRRLMEDLSGDGWAVLRHDVSRNMAVPDVKALIAADYYADSINVKALFLLGHIPVPYSGEIFPDGHTDHRGAWPADIYYTDINGIFTDVSVNNQTASRSQNWNIPGDCKFDQSYIPSPAELMAGRVDFYDMPAFNSTEINLMKHYLHKDHAFRMAEIRVANGGLIDDNFGSLGGLCFAASAWQSFPPLVGDSSVHDADFFTVLQSQQHLWAYGCGPGWFEGATGVGSTTDFVNDSVLTIFTMLYGSWFGDWDSQNNFLRAPLASKGLPLTCCWSGRPEWHFHHMAMGLPIGYSAKWAMGDYLNPYYYNTNYMITVQAALMGDPSLRLAYVAPPQNVIAYPTIPAEITWNSSADSVDGYYVYRSSSEFGVYERISPQLVQGNVFYDPNPFNAINYYMVRAVAFYDGPSGSYYNISSGIKDTACFTTAISNEEITHLKVSVYPNPSPGSFSVYPSEKLSGSVELQILDIQGRTIYSKMFHSEGNETILHVVSGIKTAGMYLLKLHTVKGTIVKRIILMP